MARPKNPENKYEVRHAKLGVPVIDEKGNLLSFDTKASADVTPEDIKKVLSFFDACAEKDSSFNVESAIEGVFKTKSDVSETTTKGKPKTKTVFVSKDDVSDSSKTDKVKDDVVTSGTDEVSDEESQEEEETDDNNTGGSPNE